MKLRLLLDEDVHFSLERALTQRGYDVKHIQTLQRKGIADEHQLAYACEQERSIFSFNVRDFVILHNQYVQTEKEHWGIIVSKQRSLQETLKMVLILLQRVSQQSMKNNLEFL